ncbi:MAG TPA: tRNA (adenosine(37)-N6)-threonylcarbamoyltransferase complex dimerization subunit type 1 TsaB [Bryobacteraceae bacterium]|nr:tRNA (adenosine(37)-N6)-threonylcarbamoyltransferase complex dimerization subunit type 1 TsaB [Bryobacteraceae bacterium]
MILSVDTTSEFGSIALTEGERTLEEILLHSPEGFSPILFQHIQQLLDTHGLKVDAMECFAAASGPGSFTGVRVGLSAVKGLAEATGRRVVAVSNLRTIASFGTAPLRAVVLDARRGEVYAAVYNDRLEAVLPESVMKFPAWLEALPREGFEFISTDFSAFQKLAPPEVPVLMAPRGLAAAVGRIAWREFRGGRACDPEEIDANYVRRSDAELFWKDPVTRLPSK